MSVAPTLTAVEPPYVQVEIRDCPGAGRPWGWDVVIPSWVDGGTIHSWVVPGELGRPHCRVCRFGVQAISGRQSHRGLPNGVEHATGAETSNRSARQTLDGTIERRGNRRLRRHLRVGQGRGVHWVQLCPRAPREKLCPYMSRSSAEPWWTSWTAWLGQCTDCPFDMRAKHLLGRIPTHKIALHV